ncbi:F-box protein SKIP14 [Euphorbia lathyris]|uniref:F-box protein SKIP14 n=1 Tax=Euphorbia lathyris TaxID=212925 RepID=UPI003313A618
MALNFSRRPLFPGHLPEDSLVSPMRIANGYLVESKPEKVENCFDYGRDKSDRCGSQDSVNKDILDLLPSDPFGMDISTTFTAITGWLEDLEADYGGYGRDQGSTSDGNYQLFAGLNFIWNNAIRFQSFPGSMSFDNSWNTMGGFGDGCSEVGDASSHGTLGMAFNIDDILSFGNELISNKSASAVVHKSGVFQEGGELSSDGDGGSPHAALAFSLSYLGVRDLLVVEQVCKSLRCTVRSDPLLWRSIHIDQPLNEKITDDVLLQLTNRAQGNLQCLSLVECPRITDDGLKKVLDTNPRLTTLSVPGCTKLSIEGIVTSLKAFRTTGMQGVKHLRIGGLYGVTQKHFEELKFLLGVDERDQQNPRKPHFYRRGNFYLSCDDDCIIDIEACPRCQNLRLVYDCPAEGCQQKDNSPQTCRACTLCIARCVQCGRCINDSEYEETFCLELLCSDCSDCCKQLLKCQEKQERKISHPMTPALHDTGCSHRVHG